jgi:hypothetical protein
MSSVLSFNIGSGEAIAVDGKQHSSRFTGDMNP